MPGVRPEIIKPGGGNTVQHDGWEAVIKLDAEVTDGSLTVLETRHDPGTGASPHVHSHESETFMVLEGEFTFRVGDADVEVGAGAVVFGPQGVVHGFEPGPSGGRLLHVFVPSGMEGFFTQPRRDESPEAGDRLRQAYGIASVDE
jgi:mannose-6-phosphate isomerase-like protein (cupin superfamily)